MERRDVHQRPTPPHPGHRVEHLLHPGGVLQDRVRGTGVQRLPMLPRGQAHRMLRGQDLHHHFHCRPCGARGDHPRHAPHWVRAYEPGHLPQGRDQGATQGGGERGLGRHHRLHRRRGREPTPVGTGPRPRRRTRPSNKRRRLQGRGGILVPARGVCHCRDPGRDRRERSDLHRRGQLPGNERVHREDRHDRMQFLHWRHFVPEQ
mmetsp:Transcript_7975/g.17263  ORF Transcript_7975/g.17263 Transcript_7975/m.17263 type:complete len:205 (-) Transcript_7975:684-1298(-)